MTEKELDFELNAAVMPVNSIAWGENDFVIPADKAIEILKKQQAEIQDSTRVKDEWVQVFLPMTEYCDKEKIGSLGQSFVGAFIDSHKALTQRVKELEWTLSNLDSYLSDKNKFALEKHDEGVNACIEELTRCYRVALDESHDIEDANSIEVLIDHLQQLRKGGE
tara:strand:+ start:2113 stop:2607 length:495 start_codon:yes stop_codon:yes gene_type:complete